MKYIKRILFPAFTLLLLITACTKQESTIYYEGGTAPVLTASSTAAMSLNIADKDKNALTLSWTNPNYKFTSGPNSHDVSYTLQIDTTGSNFTNPKMGQIVIAKDLATTFTVGSLNGALLGMGLLEDKPHNIEMRIKSTVENSVPLYSNVIKMTITPYLDVKYPVPAALYITGDATPASWQCGCGEAPPAAQTFTKINSSTFKLTVQLNGGKSYLLLPQYGSWSAKYGGNVKNGNNVNGDEFKPSGEDLLAPPTTGTYTITVDFKTGKFTVQ